MGLIDRLFGRVAELAVPEAEKTIARAGSVQAFTAMEFDSRCWRPFCATGERRPAACR